MKIYYGTISNNICIMRVSKEKRYIKERHLLKEIMDKKLPKSGNDMDNKVHETQMSQIKFNQKKTSPRHIII